MFRNTEVRSYLMLAVVLAALAVAYLGVTAVKQDVSSANTKTVAAADASPGSPWVGEWEETRSNGYVRQLVTLVSASTTIDGTFTFEYSEDGSTATISEERAIGDFTTLRDFDLLNAGAYFRVQFEPGVALGSETVIITTTYRKTFDGFFVRLAGQQIEEANAAMPQSFSYLKAFIESTGKSTNIRATDDGFLIISDFLTEVAKGNITGHTLVRGFGRNPDIDAAAGETIWNGGGTYSFPTATETVDVVSSDANDTSAGTGARTITIEGLDGSYAPVSETITLAGASTVTTSNQFLRIQSVYVASAGSGGQNAGTITLTQTTSGGTLAAIPATFNESTSGFYTVPAGQTGYLLSVTTSPSANNATNLTTRFFKREFGGLLRLQGVWGTSGGGPFAQDGFTAPIELPGRSDIRFDGVVTSNNTVAFVGFSILLVDD